MTPRRSAGQFSIRQILVLVAYSAVVCAFAAPLVETRHQDWRNTMIMFHAVALPMSLSVLSLVLLRNGQLKDRFVAGFMGLAVLAMLGVVNLYMVDHWPRQLDSKSARVSIMVANAILVVPAVYLGWRAVGVRASKR